MLPKITKRDFENRLNKDYSIDERIAIEARIATNPKEYQMENIFITDGYRGWLSQYQNVHEEIVFGG